MKKNKSSELRKEYRREDLGKGVRGKHLDSYRRGSNVVLLEPDVARAFPTSESVNDALLSLMRIARVQIRRTKSPRRTEKSTK